MKQQVIIELWEQTGKQSAGASELDLIQQALLARFGAGVVESPASIARTLADHGVPLQHPGVLEADLRWRQGQMTALFSPEELNLETLEAAISLIEKIENLHRQFENSALENLRQSVLQMKIETRNVSRQRKDGEEASTRARSRAVADSLAAKPANLWRMARTEAGYSGVPGAFRVIETPIRNPTFWNFPTLLSEYQ